MHKTTCSHPQLLLRYIQLSCCRTILTRRYSTTISTECHNPTQQIVTNTSVSATIEFKNALNKIPRRILYELLKKNRIKVCCAGTNNYKWSPSKKLLLSKIYRLTTSYINKSNNNHHKTRLEIKNFVKYSSELVRKTSIKLRDLNAYYNTNYHTIINNDNDPFHYTVSTLNKQIDSFNMNIFEIETSNINPSIDCYKIDSTLKRDFLYELLPSIHNDMNQMIVLYHTFIKFINFPRFTLFDHIQFISHLCIMDDILNGFLMHRMDTVHPSRTRYHDDNEYDEYDEDDDEFEIERVSKHRSFKEKQSLPMSEDKLKELYFARLKNIHSMDLSKYGLFGVDANVATQLKRALLSRGLDPLFINEESNDGISIQHNKGILLYGPPGTGKTLLAKALTNVLLTRDDNVSVVSGPEIEDVYIGQTERNIRKLFETANTDYKEYGIYSPLHIIIFDEIDSIAKKRDSGSNSKVYDRAVQQLLSCLDGANALNNVVCIATTNRYQDIDNALLRPGRFGVHVHIALPDQHQREELFTKYQNIQSMMDHNIKWLIDLTEGLSHSDIVALITQSKINAIERVIDQFFEHNGDDHHNLYQNVRNKFKITSRDIVCALDEIRINQIYRERNNRLLTDNYAYDIVF